MKFFWVMKCEERHRGFLTCIYLSITVSFHIILSDFDPIWSILQNYTRSYVIQLMHMLSNGIFHTGQFPMPHLEFVSPAPAKECIHMLWCFSSVWYITKCRFGEFLCFFLTSCISMILVILVIFHAKLPEPLLA